MEAVDGSKNPGVPHTKLAGKKINQGTEDSPSHERPSKGGGQASPAHGEKESALSMT